MKSKEKKINLKDLPKFKKNNQNNGGLNYKKKLKTISKKINSNQKNNNQIWLMKKKMKQDDVENKMKQDDVEKKKIIL